MTRVRFRFAKLGKVRFTSHRDVARMWERALRRARLPVTYSGGFSPRPKIAFGLALSTGHESVAEYLDVTLDADDAGVEELPARLSPELPVGVDVTAAAVLRAGSTSLQEEVGSCDWRITVRDLPVADAESMVDATLGADELLVLRTRKGREVTDDLRPAILALTVAGITPQGVEIQAELAVHPRSVRPAELLRALSPDRVLVEGPVLRTAQWIWRDGAREEPLRAAPDATARPQAEALSASRRDSPDGRPPAERADPRDGDDAGPADPATGGLVVVGRAGGGPPG
jgi:radical SAM-linked protein